jgi:hypothetical protein
VLPSLTLALEGLVSAEDECTKANVEENDYTVLRAEDLRWELELIQKSLGKRVAFIENQIVSRETTNVRRPYPALTLTLTPEANPVSFISDAAHPGTIGRVRVHLPPL